MNNNITSKITWMFMLNKKIKQKIDNAHSNKAK
jgi:hypothetical protein